MSQIDATPVEGVSDGGVPLAITSADTHNVTLQQVDEPRDAVEQAAAQRSRKSRDDAMRAAVGLPPEAEDLSEAPEPPEAPVSAQEARAAETSEDPTPAPASESPSQPTSQLVEVLVDGVKRQMPLEDVIKGYQLEQSSRKRFDEAAQMRREALAYYQAQQQQLATKAPAPDAGAAPKPAANVDFDALAEKLAYGNKDDIKAVLETLVTRPAPAAPQMDPQATTAMALEAVERRLEAERTQQDLRQFATEFQDVISDQDLNAAAAKRAEKIMADELLSLGADPQIIARMTAEQVGHWHSEARRVGKATPLGNVLRSAAEQTRQKFSKASAPAQASTEAKVDRKRNLPQPPSTASARAPAPQEPRSKTPAEIIAEERSVRGLVA